jgi:hypothetical protein
MLRSNRSLPRAGRIPQICAVGHCHVSALPASSHSRRHRRIKGRSLSLLHSMKATTGRLSPQQRRHVNVPPKYHRLAKISASQLPWLTGCPRSCACAHTCVCQRLLALGGIGRWRGGCMQQKHRRCYVHRRIGYAWVWLHHSPRNNFEK